MTRRNNDNHQRKEIEDESNSGTAGLPNQEGKPMGMHTRFVMVVS